LKVYIGGDCKTTLINRRADLCKLEEITAINPFVSIVVDMFLKFSNFKFICPMTPKSIQVIDETKVSTCVFSFLIN
jgi:hypothetical protein